MKFDSKVCRYTYSESSTGLCCAVVQCLPQEKLHQGSASDAGVRYPKSFCIMGIPMLSSRIEDRYKLVPVESPTRDIRRVSDHNEITYLRRLWLINYPTRSDAHTDTPESSWVATTPISRSRIHTLIASRNLRRISYSHIAHILA